MIFQEIFLKGVFIITPEPYKDNRGLLRRHYCQDEFQDKDLMTEILQCHISENTRMHTLRGFHYQEPPYGENKCISCLKGSIYDIVVDLREDSNTYLKWKSVTLNDENRLSLYVPKGCANAFITLGDESIIHYYSSQRYTPGVESGIRYNDPMFNFVWPCRPKVISEKDLSHPDFIVKK